MLTHGYELIITGVSDLALASVVGSKIDAAREGVPTMSLVAVPGVVAMRITVLCAAPAVLSLYMLKVSSMTSRFIQTTFKVAKENYFHSKKNRCFINGLSLPFTFKTSLFKPSQRFTKYKLAEIFFLQLKFLSCNVNPCRIKFTVCEVLQVSRN